MMTMTTATRYREVVPVALDSIARQAHSLGVPLVGILGDDAHTYGAHLSEARLQGTGHPRDYTLRPPPGTNNHHAAAAIDLGMGPEWMGEWLEDVRARCATGEIGFLGELIGDPDLVLGPGNDAHAHLYASGPEWKWVPYTGTGHVSWCHLWVLRTRLSDAGLGVRLFEGWTKDGREDDTVNAAEVEAIVRAMRFPIPNHTYDQLGEILPALSGLADRLAGANREKLIADVRDAVLAELRSSAE